MSADSTSKTKRKGARVPGNKAKPITHHSSPITRPVVVVEDDPLLTFRNAIVTPHIAAAPRFNALGDFEDLVIGLDQAFLESTAKDA